ncbi:hypothetical protein K439DRAFT_536104 [Ramaria rubella]|nr:hypothetical protein K439DRAFT_536104 [Ramaria rubella]
MAYWFLRVCQWRLSIIVNTVSATTTTTTMMLPRNPAATYQIQFDKGRTCAALCYYSVPSTSWLPLQATCGALRRYVLRPHNSVLRT